MPRIVAPPSNPWSYAGLRAKGFQCVPNSPLVHARSCVGVLHVGGFPVNHSLIHPSPFKISPLTTWEFHPHAASGSERRRWCWWLLVVTGWCSWRKRIYPPKRSQQSSRDRLASGMRIDTSSTFTYNDAVLCWACILHPWRVEDIKRKRNERHPDVHKFGESSASVWSLTSFCLLHLNMFPMPMTMMIHAWVFYMLTTMSHTRVLYANDYFFWSSPY